MAFTAAKWSLYCCTGRRLELFHTRSWTGGDKGRDHKSLNIFRLTATDFPGLVSGLKARAHLVVVTSGREVLVVGRPFETAHFLPVTLQPPLSRRGVSDIPL